MVNKEAVAGVGIGVSTVGIILAILMLTPQPGLTISTYQGSQALVLNNVMFVLPKEQWCYKNPTNSTYPKDMIICCSRLQGCWDYPTKIRLGEAYCTFFVVDNQSNLNGMCYGYAPRLLMNQNIVRIVK